VRHASNYPSQARFPTSETILVLWQGMQGISEDARRRGEEIAARRLDLDPGMTVINTVGMDADDAAEELVGEALSDNATKHFYVFQYIFADAGVGYSQDSELSGKASNRKHISVDFQKGDSTCRLTIFSLIWCLAPSPFR
jgi:hypothetical protein